MAGAGYLWSADPAATRSRTESSAGAQQIRPGGNGTAVQRPGSPGLRTRTWRRGRRTSDLGTGGRWVGFPDTGLAGRRTRVDARRFWRQSGEEVAVCERAAFAVTVQTQLSPPIGRSPDHGQRSFAVTGRRQLLIGTAPLDGAERRHCAATTGCRRSLIGALIDLFWAPQPWGST